MTDENMPTIEREIPYTLSAYSGGLTNEGQNKRIPLSNESDGKVSPDPELIQPGKHLYSDKDHDQSQDVYDFKESDDDGLDKKNENYDANNVAIRRSITSDQDEDKAGCDVNIDKKRKANEDDNNMNGSSVDADDESDEKVACSRRMYKQRASRSRFSSRLSPVSSEPRQMVQNVSSSTLEPTLGFSKGKKNNLQKSRSKYISPTRTSLSTRSKTAKLGTDSRRIDESTTPRNSPHLSRDCNITSVDSTKSSVSASSLVLAALSAAEQDLGTNLSTNEINDTEKRSVAPIDGINYPEKEIQPEKQDDRNVLRAASVENDLSITMSIYSDTQKTNQVPQENLESTTTAPKENDHLLDKSASSVTITPQNNEHDNHEKINSCKSNDANNSPASENRASTDYVLRTHSPNKPIADDLDHENFKVGNIYAAQEKIDDIENHSSPPRTQTLNAVDIIPVPNANSEIASENASTFEEYSKKNALHSNYNKIEVNSSSTFSNTQVKSPLPRQPTPSSSLIEAHSQHHSNSRSPSSLPPPPTTPHFPTNSYPAHFPSAELTQFSNQLYHSGLDTLARSCYPQFRPHSNSTPTDYSTFSRSSAPSVDFISHSIPPSTHEGSYVGGINGMSNFPSVNGTSTGISSSPSSSSLDLSQASSSSVAAIAAATVADILPPPANPRSPFGNNSSPSHLSPFYPSHCNMINEHLLNVASGPKDLTSPRMPPSHMQNAESAVRQSTNPYIHQNYSLYESSRFPAGASSVGYATPPTPPNNHNRLPHISPGSSPYHHYGYFQ